MATDRPAAPRGGDASADLPPWLRPELAALMARHRGHALLLHGAQGSGQWELAGALAAAWLCETPVSARADGAACGHCAACRLRATGGHPDLRLVVPPALQALLQPGAAEAGDDDTAGGGETGGARRKPSRDIRVDDVRALGDWAARSTSRGGLKVALLHPADAMNDTAANALLKTLEEPPGPVRLILTSSEPMRLLATVRSRCQQHALRPPPPEAALAWLRERGLAGPEVLLAAAGGRPLAALALAQEGLAADFWQALGTRVAQGDTAAFSGLPVPRLVDALQRLCHDAMAVAAGAPPRFLPAGSVPPPRQPGALLAWQRALLQAARHADHPWQAPLLTEALVGQGRAAWAAKGASLHSGA
jgi:DNA polymerase III subunit delta'